MVVPALARPRLRAKLVFVTASATVAVLTATAWATVRYFRGKMLEVAAEASSTESDALRVVLEEQMMAGDRALLRHLVTSIGQQPNIQWVGLLDPRGRVQVSSEPGALGRTFDMASPDCRVCHTHPRAERSRSVSLVHRGASVLRTVTPIVNRPPCHRCHPAEQRLNGVLIIDRSLEPLAQAVASSRRQVLLGGAGAMVVLLVSLGLAVERLVLSRLRRLRMAARDLGRGDLAARAGAASDDELGDLARDFNLMAERLEAAMASLAAEHRQLDELVNGIVDGVVLVDDEVNLLAGNRAFAARLPPGTVFEPGTPYEAIARAAGLVPPARVPAALALASGRLEKAIVPVAGAHGERFEEVYAQPLRGRGGAVVAAIEVWRDITDRKALEAGLEQSERLAGLGMLASSVAHEVGNPLASIATAVEGLLRRLDEPGGAPTDDMRDYLSIVRKQVFRCREVTERLLGFARVPSANVVTVDAAATAREVLALVAPQAHAQRVEIRSVLDAVAPAQAEDLLLQQVLLNLVLNALRAMPHGGVLRVEARADPGGVRVAVSDTGAGIPAEVRPHLFEPFRRAGTQGLGTGLGLFICHMLVTRCGGSIAVASESGKGSTFTVELCPGARPGSSDRGEPVERGDADPAG